MATQKANPQTTAAAAHTSNATETMKMLQLFKDMILSATRSCSR